MKPIYLSFSPGRKWVGKLLSMVLLMVLMTGMAFAQQKTVTGKVSDETGVPVPGATVIVKGTTIGAVTDMDGKFSINVPAASKSLAISFIGMKPQEILIGSQSNFAVTMIAETVGIDEVVAIGYSSASRKNVASSIAKISDKDIVGLSVSDVRQTLQGKMAGVQVTSNGGDPGSGARVVIRGMGSFTNPDPLYVVDGIQGGDINSIPCLLYTSDAADEEDSVDLGGRRIIKKKK